ncbi:MAG: amidohydrolase family protein [Candidatus Eremiobacterales bacterium]
MLDVILRGGLIVDGTGTPGYYTDIALKDGRIARIGDCSTADAAERLDCTGLAIAPGFIDMHGHSDEILLVDPLADAKIRQGVTTEVGGNCGASPGPLSQDEFDSRKRSYKDAYGFDLETSTIGGFLDALDSAEPVMNFCTLVGCGETRAAVGGIDDTPLDKDALRRECDLVRDACEQGAIGISSGLIYPPGRFADIAELTALASAARDAGSPLYASHIRSEGRDLVEAVEEALEIGARTGVGVQLSHHKASGKANWGKVHDSLALVERSRTSGNDVVLDQYPYKASSTGLDVILPKDVNVGSADVVLARLADKRYAALVAARVELEYADRWNDVMIAAVASEKHRGFEGMTVAQIAQSQQRRPVVVALDLLVQERLQVAAIFFTMCEDDVRTVLSYAHTSIGSDASVRSVGGITARGKPHPRAFGTFPRIFKRYVRDSRLLTLEEAVRRATRLPATRLGLRDRGELREGWHADIVAFDPATLSDMSTYEDPYRYPVGLSHVFVNGVAVVRDGLSTGSKGGRVLRRGRDL